MKPISLTAKELKKEVAKYVKKREAKQGDVLLTTKGGEIAFSVGENGLQFLTQPSDRSMGMLGHTAKVVPITKEQLPAFIKKLQDINEECFS